MGVVTRRRFLLAAAATAAAIGVEALVLEPRRIRITRHRLGDGPRPLRVVQLSDLHLQGIHQFELDVASAVVSVAPDTIVITGDSIDSLERVEVLDEFLAMLPPATPKYAVLGNWDYWSGATTKELRAVYERHRCRLLINETVTHEHDGGIVRFSGADDLIGGRPDIDALTTGDPQVPHVLLAHCPAYREHVERAAQARFTCMLSGHTHGGQVRFFGFAPVLPRGSGGYISGWYRDQSRLAMYVSRGIGTSLIRARLGATPEIAVLEIG